MSETSSKPTGEAALTRPAADAVFATASIEASVADQCLAILAESGRIVYAAPAALSLFHVANSAELSGKLAGRETPTARRLRHLARTLPIGPPGRLERMRFANGRRPLVVNLRCARVLGANGDSLLVLFASAPASAELGGIVEEPLDAQTSSRTQRKARFLWAVDELGRFGAEDFTLGEALGPNAPRQGESLEDLSDRAAIEGVGVWTSAVGRRETFSDLLLTWPAARAGFRVQIRLSGAPIFGRAREFQGFRGFGVIEGDPYAAAEVEWKDTAPVEPPVPETFVDAGEPETSNAGAQAIAPPEFLDARAGGGESSTDLPEEVAIRPVDLAPDIVGDEFEHGRVNS